MVDIAKKWVDTLSLKNTKKKKNKKKPVPMSQNHLPSCPSTCMHAHMYTHTFSLSLKH
jgi:hypothetical protein